MRTVRIIDGPPPRPRRISGCLIITNLVLFPGCLVIEGALKWRVTPPRKMQSVANFARWRPEVNKYYVTELSGRQFLIAYGSRGGTLPSGPSAYVFDSTGRFVDWSWDIGDDSRFDDKWNAQRTRNSAKALNREQALAWPTTVPRDDARNCRKLDSSVADLESFRLMHDTYESPLSARNASKEMLALFSPARKFSLWRRLWVELARAEKELGIQRISEDAIRQMEAKVDEIDFGRAAELEKKLRHDVMAHVHTFEEAAPAAKGIIHLGATSQYVVDNADLIIMRDAMRLIGARLANAIDALGKFAQTWRDLPTLGYTHFQPAQLTTVGKRATLWAQDFVIDLEEIESRIANLRFRGVKGTTGTQASFLALFAGDHEKCERLDQLVTQRFGFERSFVVTGQTYPRKIDAMIVGSLANIAASVHKFANDLRLLAGLKQIEEPFEKDQVGSSAMAYKRNPMRSERATGLARFVMSLAFNPLQTAAEQWLERTLDDSSNKRLSIPEAFLALDGAMMIVIDVARGLVVNRSVIESSVRAELPFMASEEILMSAVRGGGDRQELHERIRKHSVDAAAQVKQHGRVNDLLERLRADAAFSSVEFERVLDPSRFVGRAPEQVDRFLTDVVEPIRRRHVAQLNQEIELSV